ncbi:hypothetical protein AVEN_186147-1 [Araneus ventricosus]|uniref:Uncharacterized protein n=1 Tax=Araneus ventricosus TaxID=182803 RepID=A0A4Y2DSQ5_ARAVE|nr:hypothetical protein AVEN_186147-1 [Araneus ventricosus]
MFNNNYKMNVGNIRSVVRTIDEVQELDQDDTNETVAAVSSNANRIHHCALFNDLKTIPEPLEDNGYPIDFKFKPELTLRLPILIFKNANFFNDQLTPTSSFF